MALKPTKHSPANLHELHCTIYLKPSTTAIKIPFTDWHITGQNQKPQDVDQMQHQTEHVINYNPLESITYLSQLLVSHIDIIHIYLYPTITKPNTFIRRTKVNQASSVVLLDMQVALVWAVGMRGTWGSMISSGWWIIGWEKDVETLGLMRGVSKKGRNWLLCFFSMCLMCCIVSHSIHHASCIGKTLYALSCCRLQVSHHQQCRIEEPPEDSHTWTKS